MELIIKGHTIFLTQEDHDLSKLLLSWMQCSLSSSINQSHLMYISDSVFCNPRKEKKIIFRYQCGNYIFIFLYIRDENRSGRVGLGFCFCNLLKRVLNHANKRDCTLISNVIKLVSSWKLV